MPRAIQSTFFEPLIHGLDVMLATAERVIAGERTDPNSDAFAESQHRDLVNLPGLAEKVAAHHKTAAGARSIHLFVNVPPDALVVGDFHGLHRVVEQLFVSVLENTPFGGCVTVSGTASHGVVTLTFSSDSPGQPADVHGHIQTGSRAIRPRCLTPGFRFCPSEVGEILRAHHGRMEVSEQPGHWPRFVVHLPVG